LRSVKLFFVAAERCPVIHDAFQGVHGGRSGGRLAMKDAISGKPLEPATFEFASPGGGGRSTPPYLFHSRRVSGSAEASDLPDIERRANAQRRFFHDNW
jgi:hypothetical protein